MYGTLKYPWQEKTRHKQSCSRTLLQWTVCCLFWHLCISQSLEVIIDCKHTLVHMKWETKPRLKLLYSICKNDDGWRSLVLTQSTYHFTSLLLYDCRMKWTQWNTHDFMAPLLLFPIEKSLYLSTMDFNNRKKTNFKKMEHMRLCYAIELPEFA